MVAEISTSAFGYLSNNAVTLSMSYYSMANAH